MAVNLPTYIPLEEAARRYGLSRDVLTQLIEDDRIEAVTTAQGDILVSDDGAKQTKTKEQIIAEKFGHLQNNPITVSEAEAKYSLQNMTIRRWIAKGYIEVLEDNYPIKIHEAEVAYCASIYHQRQKKGVRSGAPLLDENGLPYELKHPELSEYRRLKRRKRRKTQA
jgi:hypothetical protein